MEWKGLPLFIFGTGGCAKEIKALIDEINVHSPNSFFLHGFVSNCQDEVGDSIEGIRVVTTNEDFPNYCGKFPVIGIVLGIANPRTKKTLFENIMKENIPNIVFPNLIHPNSIISKTLTNDFGYGNVICSGVNLTVNIKMGNFILLNRSCNIGHDSVIGDFCTINPSAVISGNVDIGHLSLIGAGACIREKTNIGIESIVGLGAIVIKDVISNTTVISKAATRISNKVGTGEANYDK